MPRANNWKFFGMTSSTMFVVLNGLFWSSNRMCPQGPPSPPRKLPRPPRTAMKSPLPPQSVPTDLFKRGMVPFSRALVSSAGVAVAPAAMNRFLHVKVFVAITSPSRLSSWTVTWYSPSFLNSVMSLTQCSGSTCTLPVASASAR